MYMYVSQFEVKPTRLLLMSLTDGVTDFQAMEYQPIPQINSELIPGSKVSQPHQLLIINSISDIHVYSE